MWKKKIKVPVRTWWSQELKNIVAGVTLIFLWILAFFGDDSIVWIILQPFLNKLFWENYKYIFGPVLVLLGTLISFHKLIWNYTRIFGLFFYWFSLSSLIWYWGINWWLFNFNWFLIELFGRIPALLIEIGVFLVSLFLIFRISYIKVIKRVQSSFVIAKDNLKEIKTDIKKDLWDVFEKKNTKNEYQKEVEELKKQIDELDRKKETKINKFDKKDILEKKEEVQIKVPVEKKTISEFFLPKKEEDKKQKEEKKISQISMQFPSWEYPSCDLLNKNNKKYEVDYNTVEKLSLEIKKTLLQFKIDVDMKGYTVWPTVIQYKLKPAEWVKLNKIENLKKDLTLALKAKSIRIQAPIPGMWLVGIEVPNDKRETVVIRDIMSSKEFENHKSNLALVVGKNINWENVVADLAKMPHLLIAGQTWSGKSVAMNGFIVSLLYKNSPDMLRLIMVDPKRVELSIYNWIPHLLAPIISDHEKALNSLKWSVAEMMRRYDIMTQVRARNLEEYNKKVVKKEKMPNIVIVIDELAELMWRNNKKEVENAITRIAQLGRASWMHLLVATQRPSVDVITGLIKANIPSRIALTVASQIDSRTILDQMWAEDLVGYWDMLYSPIWSEPERIQGVYVETDEVEAVINHIKRTIDPNMLEDIYDSSITEGEQVYSWWDFWSSWDWYDEDAKIIEEAIRVIKEAWKASTSLLQRRLKLWYARAARVIDILEEMWVVWPADWSKPRDVY